jgi:hypothetical protein
MQYRNPALCRVLDACRTRQSSALANDRVYQELDSRYKNTLGKETCAECQTLGKQRPSAKVRQWSSKADGRYLCRASGFGARQRSLFVECPVPDTRHSMLCRVSNDTRQSIFLFFFSFLNQTLCGIFIHSMRYYLS